MLRRPCEVRGISWPEGVVVGCEMDGSVRPRSVGTEGPKMSVSRRPVRRPWREKESARFADSVDLPTPPLAEDTAMVCRTFGSGRFVGRPRWARGMEGGGGFDDRGRPC